ncbi:MAG: YqgE/AlgH family protein [Flavobacteriaceae bacterium]
MEKKLHPGDFLIADPSILGDASFHRAVVLICVIEKKSPMGFIFNKVYDFCLNDMVPKVSHKLPLFYGGPVDTDQLFFVYHAREAIIENSHLIHENLYLGGDIEQAFEAIEDKRLNLRNSRFFLGYSGWSKGQLELEIELNSWLIQKNSAEKKLFTYPPKDLWRNAMIKKGGKYILWANAPDNPTYN